MCYTSFNNAGEIEVADKGEKIAFSTFWQLKLIAKHVPVYCKNAEVNIKICKRKDPHVFDMYLNTILFLNNKDFLKLTSLQAFLLHLHKIPT